MDRRDSIPAPRKRSVRRDEPPRSRQRGRLGSDAGRLLTIRAETLWTKPGQNVAEGGRSVYKTIGLREAKPEAPSLSAPQAALYSVPTTRSQ